MQKIEIKYPIIFNRVAKDLANDRTIGMHKNYKHKDYYWGDKTRELNEQGILAELIAQYFLDKRGTKYKALSFLGQEPEVEADLIIDPDINCDVKYIPHYGKFLLVNFRSHTNTAKKVDSYIFVKPTKEADTGYCTAFLWYVKSDEVSNWIVETQFKTKVFKFIL
jgi:hypothetical protein